MSELDKVSDEKKKTKSPEEIQGEAMESFIERNSGKNTDEKIQEEVMETPVTVEDKKLFIRSSKDIAMERADKIISEGKSEKEIKIEKKEEKNERLEKLKQELNQARKEYLEVDYKKNKALNRLRKFFGGVFKDKRERGLENDKDIAWCRAHYDNKLFEYKNALLEDAKAHGTSNKELGEILRFFETEAKITMVEEHDNIKFENQDIKWPGRLKINTSKMIESYRKLSLMKKIAIGAAFGFGATALGSGGAVMAGVAVSAVTARKIFMGMVAGTGAALTAEKLTQRGREKSVEEEVGKFGEEAEKLKDKEDIEEWLKDKINNLIYDEDQKINTIKNKNLRNMGIGIGAGVASAVFLPIIVKNGAEWISHTGVGEKISEFFGLSGHDHEVPSARDDKVSGNAVRMKIVNDGNNDGNIGEAAKEAVKSVNPVETVEKGDKVWTLINKQLENRFENDYNELNPAKKTYIIDALKNKVAKYPSQFGLEDADKIVPGQKVNFASLFEDKGGVDKIFEDANNLKQESLNDILKNNKSIVDWLKEHPGQSLDSKGTESILNEKISNNPIEKAIRSIREETVPDTGDANKNPIKDALESLKKDEPTYEKGAIEKAVDESLKNSEIPPAEKEMPITALGAAGGIVGVKTVEKIKSGKNKKEFKKLEDKYEFKKNDNFFSRARKIIIFLSSGKVENWKILKEADMDDFVSEKGTVKSKWVSNVKKMEKEFIKLLGDSARHKKGEKIKSWLARNTDNMLEAEAGEENIKIAA
jgi:hypothetical protein